MESLFRIGNQPPPSGQVPPRPENKRVLGQFARRQGCRHQEVAQETRRRDPEGIKTRVALTDGERALQIKVEGTLGVTLVPDLLEVLERFWNAAHVFTRRRKPGG